VKTDAAFDQESVVTDPLGVPAGLPEAVLVSILNGAHTEIDERVDTIGGEAVTYEMSVGGDDGLLVTLPVGEGFLRSVAGTVALVDDPPRFVPRGPIDLDLALGESSHPRRELLPDAVLGTLSHQGDVAIGEGESLPLWGDLLGQPRCDGASLVHDLIEGPLNP